jgi:hypothetical protein
MSKGKSEWAKKKHEYPGRCWYAVNPLLKSKSIQEEERVLVASVVYTVDVLGLCGRRSMWSVIGLLPFVVD